MPYTLKIQLYRCVSRKKANENINRDSNVAQLASKIWIIL